MTWNNKQLTYTAKFPPILTIFDGLNLKVIQGWEAELLSVEFYIFPKKLRGNSDKYELGNIAAITDWRISNKYAVLSKQCNINLCSQ